MKTHQDNDNLRAKEDNHNDDFFLPNFCNVHMVFSVVVIAELLAIVLTLAPLGRPSNRWEDLSITSLFVQWVAIISAIILCVSRPWLRKLNNTYAAVTSYFMLLITTTLISEITYLTVQWMTASKNSSEWHYDFLISNLGICTIVSAIVLRYFYIQHQSARNIEAKSQARIQALQSRIRPHFLFNSLNTIASLTRSNAELAEEATEDLADLFRSTLADSKYESKLSEEWELVKRYLHIEKLRLGDRLQVNWDIAPLPKDALIPQLSIQPLLENAIYHGIEQLSSGGTINIKGIIKQGQITIVITNPTPAPNDHTSRATNKMAQENVRLRLSALYQGQGSLAVVQDNSNYLLTLQFPYITQRL